MYFWVKTFSFIFFLHYVTTKFFVNYTFNAMPLGHSGLLITWEPQSKETSSYYFEFHTVIGEDEDNGNSTCDNHQSLGIKEIRENETSEENRIHVCHSTQRSCKISSLNESILYEVIVGQHTKNSSLVRTYCVKMRTNPKSRQRPAKPHFEFQDHGLIRWYPCGRERICNDQESGTHFGVKIRNIYSTRKMSEIKQEELDNDFIGVNFLPGRVYEVVVFSINDEYETDSDSQEIFFNAVYSTVQYVKMISLSDSSVLISWNPPKQLQNGSSLIHMYQLFCIPHFNEPYTSEENDILFHESYCKSVTKTNFTGIVNEQIRLSKLLPKVTYTFMIIPLGIDELGFDYWTKYKVQVFNPDLQIAKPDFHHKLLRNDSECLFSFQWLPCGLSFDCQNTKPGSEYSFQFEPEPPNKYDLKDNGCIEGKFYSNLVYQVTLNSSINGNFSESLVKKFKNCNEI